MGGQSIKLLDMRFGSSKPRSDLRAFWNWWILYLAYTCEEYFNCLKFRLQRELGQRLDAGLIWMVLAWLLQYLDRHEVPFVSAIIDYYRIGATVTIIFLFCPIGMPGKSIPVEPGMEGTGRALFGYARRYLGGEEPG